MKPLPDSTTITKKRIAYAAAAATLFAPAATVAGDTPSSMPNNINARMMTGTSRSKLHETLWGNPPVEDAYTTVDPSSTLNIPRGGTDESSPSKKDNKKKKKRRNSKTEKKKKDKTDSTPQKQEEEEEEEKPYTNPIMEEILGKEDFYDILGLPRGEENHARIKKAYRRRAVQTHPDKTGGDRRAFDKLAEAYEVLLDDDKRTIYDRYGKEGLDPTRGPMPGRGASAEDMFRSFFGGGPPQQRRPPTVNRTVRYQLQVTLEELYRGKTKPVTVEAPRGNSFYAQFEPPSAKKQVQVTIPRGAQPGQSIVLSGEMDFDSKDAPPGDLIFQLQVRVHKSFTRKGHDLALEQTISFREALCGFTRRFQHLSGKYMTVESAKHPVVLSDLETPTTTTSTKEEEKSEESEEEAPQPTAPAHIFIKTGDVQVLKGKGMPKNPHGTEFGDLYIQYNVELPRAGRTDNLTPAERLELARLLEKLEGKSASSSSSPNKKSKETFTLEPARASDFGRASGPVHTAAEEDHHPHIDEQHHPQQHQFPFGGTGHRQFFFSSNGGSPFFGQQQNFEDDDVQCRHM